jgi:hypothetical protein
LNYGVVEESSIAVAIGSAILFSCLKVVNLIFGKEVVVLLGKVVL